jgi:hypothetical protein
MKRVNLTYPGAASLVRRMMKKGFAVLGGTVNANGSKANLYLFSVIPEDYLRGERNMKLLKPPKSTFYNNPFKLREAKDARYNP